MLERERFRTHGRCWPLCGHEYQGAPLSVEEAFEAGCVSFMDQDFTFGDPEDYLHPPGHPHNYRPEYATCEHCTPPVHGECILMRAGEDGQIATLLASDVADRLYSEIEETPPTRFAAFLDAVTPTALRRSTVLETPEFGRRSTRRTSVLSGDASVSSSSGGSKATLRRRSTSSHLCSSRAAASRGTTGNSSDNSCSRPSANPSSQGGGPPEESPERPVLCKVAQSSPFVGVGCGSDCRGCSEVVRTSFVLSSLEEKSELGGLRESQPPLTRSGTTVKPCRTSTARLTTSERPRGMLQRQVTQGKMKLEKVDTRGNATSSASRASRARRGTVTIKVPKTSEGTATPRRMWD